jgi:CHAD domain-containing protein
MTIETETKYEAEADTELPGLDPLPGVAGTRGPDLVQLEAEYYDTADFRLLRSGITLRRRKGGQDAGWHLKLPAGADSREEIRLPLGRAGRRAPAELANLVSASTRGRPLELVASISTLRQTITVLGQDGESLAEVADDQVTARPAGSDSAPIQWREIEVELTGGGRPLLDAADRLLRQAGVRRSGRSAKLERVLGGRVPAPPATTAGPRAAAGEVVQAYLREHAHALVALDPMVRRRQPDAVHKMRVAARRLRSTLQSFGAVIRKQDSEQLAGELRWLGSVLGAERDAEVQARRLRQLARETDITVLLGPVEARIQAHVARTAAGSHAAVMAALNSQRYYALLDVLDELLSSPPAGSHASRRARPVMQAAVRYGYRRTRRRLHAAVRQPPGPDRDAALHAARKAAKRARYAAEAAIPASGQAARRLARQLKKVQSALGDHQDTVVGRQQARQLGIAAQLAGESAFTYGLFYERDACLAASLQKRAQAEWQRASRRKYRAWLG